MNGVNRHRFYHCSKSAKKVSIEPCRNRTWSADRLEEIIWEQVERALANPDILLAGLKAIKSESDMASEHLRQFELVKVKLTHLEKEKDRAWKAYRITGDEVKFKNEIEDIMSAIEETNKRQLELENRIELAKQADANIKGIKQACETVRSNLGTLSFEDKRETLETLNIRVWVDKDYLRLEGTLPIVSTASIRRDGGRLLWVCQ
ncbi:zinc ribbon domain-containing protein [Chloroflexota bacterium]